MKMLKKLYKNPLFSVFVLTATISTSKILMLLSDFPFVH